MPPVKPCSSRSRAWMRLAVCRCFLITRLSSSRICSMIGTKGSSLGRTTGADRRYPGGTECFRILATVLRSIPNRRPAALLFIPSTWHARRTRLYNSTEYISPPFAHQHQVSDCGILLRDGQITQPFPWPFYLRDSHLLHSTTGDGPTLIFFFPYWPPLATRLLRATPTGLSTRG